VAPVALAVTAATMESQSVWEKEFHGCKNMVPPVTLKAAYANTVSRACSCEPCVPRVDWARLPQAQRLRQARVQQGHRAVQKFLQCERPAAASESGATG